MDPAAIIPADERRLIRHNMATCAKLDAPIYGAQFDEYIKLLQEQKTSDLALYKATGNDRIRQLNWPTGKRVPFKHAFIHGDWISAIIPQSVDENKWGCRSQMRSFIEIHIRRIESDDEWALLDCDISPKYAFMGLIGNKGGQLSNRSSASSTSTVAALASAPPGAWPADARTPPPSPDCPPPSPDCPPVSTASYLKADDSPEDDHELASVRLDNILKSTPGFDDLKSNYSLYVVKVIALRDPGMSEAALTNHLTGPDSNCRCGTLVGTGGWVVPRFVWGTNVSEHIKGRPVKDFQTDQTFGTMFASARAKFLPIWKGEEEPRLEDVYHMVWDIVTGARFVGLPIGYGLGKRTRPAEFYEELRKKNPFAPFVSY